MPTGQEHNPSQLLLIVYSAFRSILNHPFLIFERFCCECVIFLMKYQREKHLPLINQKSISLHSVFDLIKKKKHELSNVLKASERGENLPRIQREDTSKYQELSLHSPPEVEKDELQLKLEGFMHTPVRQYRNALQQGSLTQENEKPKQKPVLKAESKPKDYDSISRQNYFSGSHVKRIKTEGPQIARKGTNTTQVETHREKQREVSEYNRIQQAKDKFLSAAQLIPKAIKLRTEGTLINAVESLEVFNPFANRNDRMVNICLLKIGRIIMCSSSVLYKLGEELDYFYIILMGKVKLSNGALKKICQTGETILEEIIFSDKPKKIALQRAKVINQAVLLEMKVEGLNKLKEQLIRHGYKLDFQEMESIIKRNYIVKNWLRNKIRLESNK